MLVYNTQTYRSSYFMPTGLMSEMENFYLKIYMILFQLFRFLTSKYYSNLARKGILNMPISSFSCFFLSGYFIV